MSRIVTRRTGVGSPRAVGAAASTTAGSAALVPVVLALRGTVAALASATVFAS